jgi:hypothetical protein
MPYFRRSELSLYHALVTPPKLLVDAGKANMSTALSATSSQKQMNAGVEKAAPKVEVVVGSQSFATPLLS